MLVAAILLAKASYRRGYPILLSVVSGARIHGEPAAIEDERAAVELVGQRGLEEATPHLVRRAWGVTRWFRDECAFYARISLARLGHARAEIPRELRSKRSEVLFGAIVSAGRARMVEARDILEALPASSVDPELRREAFAALSEEKWP